MTRSDGFRLLTLAAALLVSACGGGDGSRDLGMPGAGVPGAAAPGEPGGTVQPFMPPSAEPGAPSTGDDPTVPPATADPTEPPPDPTSDPVTTPPDPSAPPPGSRVPPSTVPEGCAGTTLGPGDHALTLDQGGRERTYDVHVPPSHDGSTPLPLVFYFHPLLMDKEYLKGAATKAKADAEGFIAVFPQGIDNSWNAGACCGPANGASGAPVDDVGFVRAMVAELQSNLCVDSKRIYATGFSNGGFLSNRLACEAADLFAAVAPVSAVNGMPPQMCNPSRPVPILALNGTADNLVPYEGGFGFPGITNGVFVSVQETFDGWAARNGCVDAPEISFANGAATCVTHDQCAGGAVVTQCTLEGAGHCWFGEAFCALGTNSFDMLATDATWHFLKVFRLP